MGKRAGWVGIAVALAVSWIVVAVVAGAGTRPGGHAASVPRAAADTSFVLAPGDSGYGDAMALADVLQRAGIRIAVVGHSKFAGFLGQRRAASFDTDRGRFAALFFREPDGAERVHWDVAKRARKYHYTFRWSESGRARTYAEDFDAPQHFLGSGPWFLITWSDSTYDVLKEALSLPAPGVG